MIEREQIKFKKNRIVKNKKKYKSKTIGQVQYNKKTDKEILIILFNTILNPFWFSIFRSLAFSRS